MKKFVYTLPAFLLLTFILISKANSADTANISVTVTPQNISITATDGSINYGSMSLSATNDTTTSGVNDSQTATNNGNITEDFNIRGQNSANWTLAATAGSDQYVHSFCKTNCDVSPTWTVLTTSYQSLSTAVSTSGTQVFDLKINTPTSSSSFTSQSVDIIVQAVAN